MIGALSALVAIGLGSRVAGAQSVDVTPPLLQDFSFTPATIDVSAGSQNIAFTARVTDDLSGAFFATVSVRGPSGVPLFVNLVRVSGTPFDGVWSGNITFPQFSAAGTWNVTSVRLFDNAGNVSDISTAVLDSRGFPTQLTVVSVSDTQPPVVTAIAIAPTAVDVSASDQPLTLTLHVTDDISGVAFTPCGPSVRSGNFAVTLRSPSGAQNRFMWPTTFSLIAGTHADGMWRGAVTMPRFSEAGMWRIQSVSIMDCAGNTRNLTETQLASAGLQIALDVAANPTDTQAPVLTSLSFLPITINTSAGSQTVTARLGIKDDLSGVDVSPTTPQASFFERGIQFTSPSGTSRFAAFFSSFQLIAGTPLDGVWESTINFPQFSEDGTWRVTLVEVKDRTRNLRTYDESALKVLGFPTTLDVIKPSLISDGTVDASGGLVVDQTFGDRAAVFFPPGTLTTSTSVAIDVLEHPLVIPNPTGFSGPGTLFVNIHLTPQPHFPLAPPGLTVILPLVNPLPAGTLLTLYKVDTLSGQLIPAIDVNGDTVKGLVDFDGLSATFSGIASLSTVVGLVPDAIRVGIDIKPGESPNTINLKSHGTLPVAILSTASFDATTVRPETVLLAGAGPKLKPNGQPMFSFEDVNGDGRLDLVIHFDVLALNLTSNDVEATLTGRTIDGMSITGKDAIRIVP
jgi:hypothetical protein